MDATKSRHGVDRGALFTSAKCPPGPGLENSCELPFGMIWTPMAQNNGAVSIIKCEGEALPPILCLTCLTYLNMFADFDYNTGIWTCPLCGESNVAPKESFQQGGELAPLLSSPIVEFHQQVVPDNPDDDALDSCTFVMVVDGNMDREEALAVASSMQSALAQALKQYSKLFLGLVVFDKNVAIYQLGLSGMATADVFTAAESNDEATLLGRKNIMEDRSYLAHIDSEDSMTCIWRCLAAVFGMSVSNDGQQSAMPDLTDPAIVKQLSRKDMLRMKKEARIRKQNLESSGYNPLTMESPWVARQKETKTSRPLRCTGEAIQCAVDLTGLGRPYPSRTSRILVFTDGCPNLGDASVVLNQEFNGNNRARHTPDVVDPPLLAKAVQYFDLTAKFALENGVGIDIFCTGSNELALPAYQALVEPSGGYVLPHLSFTTPHLEHNLSFVVKNTFISRSRLEVDADAASPAECLIDLRAAEFVTPTHLVGPGEIVPLQEANILNNERAAFAGGASLAAKQGYRTNNLPMKDMVDESMTRIKLGRLDPLTTLSVLMLVNDTIEEDEKYAFFQCIARYVDRDGKTLVTRVANHRLAVANDVGDFLDEIDEEVVPVVLAKGAVYRSLHGRDDTDESRVVPIAGDADIIEKLAYEAQLDIDATIQRISGAFRLQMLRNASRDQDLVEEGGVRAANSSLDFAFPPELAEGLRRLYHLRRGSLVSPGPMRSMDDRAEIRSIFLRFPLEDCAKMMAPSLWSSGLLSPTSPSNPTMEIVPPETLVLWDHCIIAADHHDSLFVWSGKRCKGPEYDDIRENFKSFLLERAEGRFPMPELHILAEGDSMGRRFTSRLAPSHADPPDHQIAHFPLLETLPAPELDAVRQKFRFYDASSDASFRAWFWSVASATSVSRKDGQSLCE